jgi:outer membrane protein assembly factor BamB
MNCGGRAARLILACAAAAALNACGTAEAPPAPAQASPAAEASSDSPPAPPPASDTGTDVLTYKNDNARTGANLTETALTPANVNADSFGLLRVLSVDGKVDAQPLFVSQLTVSGSPHDVAIVATEHDSVYAFDVNDGSILWQVSLLGPGETTSDPRGCEQVVPEIGVTSTPVIDRHAGPNGAIYVVAMSKDDSGQYHQRLHALDLTSGDELFGGPVDITATFPTAKGGMTSFDPGQYEERAALLLESGTVYTAWTSHCDIAPYTGWIIAFNGQTLERTAALDIAPNSDAGPSIWMSGGGLAADPAGNLYLLAANGAFETTLDARGFPSGGDYGNSFLKLSTANGLSVADYFAMDNEVPESSTDRDLGSGGVLLLPDLMDAGGVIRHLAVGAGKDGNLYVVNRDDMGKFGASGNHIWQELDGVFPGGIFATPAYYQDALYYGNVGGTLKAFAITDAKLTAAPTSQTSAQFAYPGTSPAVSANGAMNGIVWACENTNPAVLHAYDAANLARALYDSNQAPNGRDHFGAGNKFITPTIANGKVLVGTTNGVAVFGLLQ